jgi:hypothetical protein
LLRKLALATAIFISFLGVSRISVHGQTTEIKEKPRMYTYVANWSIPRAQWGEMEKTNATTQSVLEKDVADGTLVAFGHDENLVHQPDGSTHDTWWSSMSMAGLLKVLDQAKAANVGTTVLSSATKHWDSVYVSRYYNWHPGTWKDVYTYGSVYKLKADAPDDAVDQLSKNLICPIMEKLLADGAIHEYEVDTQAVHTEAPGLFFIFYIAANAEGLDKVNAAIRDGLKANPLAGPGFGSMVDSSGHRDELAHTNATYK